MNILLCKACKSPINKKYIGVTIEGFKTQNDLCRWCYIDYLNGKIDKEGNQIYRRDNNEIF